jgi:two-component system, cell cycle sensor histidine kinase PleC
VTVTLPPERVMSALAPVHEPSPSLQPDWQNDPTNENHRARNMPIMNAGTGLKE